jgi:RND family efflux transporter MFP subunit
MNTKEQFMRILQRSCSRLAVVLAVSTWVALSSCGSEKVQEAAPVVRPVKTVVVGGLTGGEVTYPGTVQAAQRMEMSFRVDGPLIELSVREGEQVAKGQVLARIDPRDYQIAVDKARAEFTRAEAELKRYQTLYERDAVPLADLELRQSQRDVARAQLDDAELNRDYTYLRAPFAGQIGERYVENFEEVQAKQAVLSLHDVSGLEVVLDVPEAYRAQFNPDHPQVTLTVSFPVAEGREFEATLKEFSASADARTQTYKATLTLPRPEGVSIQPGMTAEVHARVSGERAATAAEFVVPSIALFAGDAGEQIVWVVDPADNTVHRREVQAGEVTGEGSIRITSGLSAGERIVVTGVNQLREGQEVRVTD